MLYFLMLFDFTENDLPPKADENSETDILNNFAEDLDFCERTIVRNFVPEE